MESGDANLEVDVIEQVSNYIQHTLETFWIMKGYLQSGSDWGRCLVHPMKLSLPLTISTLHRSYSTIVPKVMCHSSAIPWVTDRLGCWDGDTSLFLGAKRLIVVGNLSHGHS